MPLGNVSGARLVSERTIRHSRRPHERPLAAIIPYELVDSLAIGTTDDESKKHRDMLGLDMRTSKPSKEIRPKVKEHRSSTRVLGLRLDRLVERALAALEARDRLTEAVFREVR